MQPEAFSPPFGLLLSRSDTSAGRGRRGLGLDGGNPVRERLIQGTLRLLTRDGVSCYEMPLYLEIVQPDQRRRITFVSKIDGTVQYFTLQPATAGPPDNPLPAIVLSCHGAGMAFAIPRIEIRPRWQHLVEANSHLT